MAQMIRRDEAIATGPLPKYAIGDRVLMRHFLNKPGYAPEKLYVVDFYAYGTVRCWGWQYRLSWRKGGNGPNLGIIASENELLSLGEALYHATKAEVERRELVEVA